MLMEMKYVGLVNIHPKCSLLIMWPHFPTSLPTYAKICLACCGPCAHDHVIIHVHGNEKVLDLKSPLVNVHENDHGCVYKCCHGYKHYHLYDHVDYGGGAIFCCYQDNVYSKSYCSC